MRIVTSMLLLIGASGCYRYVPTTQSLLAPGDYVSIALTSRGSADVASRIGDNAAGVEGTISSTDSSGLTLALAAVKRRNQSIPVTWQGESIHLSIDEMAEIRGRRLSRSRTIAASSALGAASVGLVIAIARATGVASGGQGGRPVPTP